MESLIKKKLQYLAKALYHFDANDIIDETSIYLEKIINNDLIVIDLYEKHIKIQYNLNEKYFFENIEIIFEEFFTGSYSIKFYSNNENVLYSKFIWKKKNMRKYNFKTQYGILKFKKINKIEKVLGAIW